MTDAERRLYLIRHGRADFNSTDRLKTTRGDQWDPPLDETGRAQAQALARRLKTLPPPVAMYSSPLRRARETAAAFAGPAGIEVTEVDEVAEWFGGGWEGNQLEEIFRSHPEAIDLFRTQRPAWHLAPGSEPGAAFQTRVVDAIERIIDSHPEGDVFVVAHGGVINAYFAHILGIRDQEMFFLPENTSINTMVIRGDERLAWFLSDVAHLTDPHWFD